MKKLFLVTATYLLILFPFYTFSEISEVQKELLEQLPPDQRSALQKKMETVDDMSDEIEEQFEEDRSLITKEQYREDQNIDACEDCIYGYDFFRFSPSTFAPTSNTSITNDYVLGPGDKLLINLFGAEESETKAFISREGKIIVPLIGEINLLGLTFEEAKELLNRRVSSELVGTRVSISLSELRSISVYMLGEAHIPGKYIMSALSSVTNALFISGGVNENGSLRNIQIKRSGNIIAEYDFYDFLLGGNLDTDVKLLDGDIIFIPFIKNKVKVAGAFRRPYIYEAKDEDTVQDLIRFAGGFKSSVPQDARIEVSSIELESFSRAISSFTREEISKVLVRDSSVISISERSGVNPETIEISGQVLNPGVYSISQGETILEIIDRAGGYSTNSYSEGAVYTRRTVAEDQRQAFERSADQLEKTLIDTITTGEFTQLNEFSLTPITSLITKLRNADPLGRQIVNLDYLSIKTDPLLNFEVQDGDMLHVPKRPFSVSVIGEVLNGATLGFDPDLNVIDYIELAGGINETADSQRIFVIYPNGQSKIYKKSLFSKKDDILPGSTIVVPRDSKPYDAIKITQIVTPILADLATSAAAIAAISDN